MKIVSRVLKAWFALSGVFCITIGLAYSIPGAVIGGGGTLIAIALVGDDSSP